MSTRSSLCAYHKNKTVSSRLGKLELRVPQTRDSEFYPSALERGERSERAFKLAIAEMYVQGVSTRKVAKITEELCGTEVTSMQVSRAAAILDEELEAWRTRQLAQVEYLMLDARYVYGDNYFSGLATIKSTVWRGSLRRAKPTLTKLPKSSDN